MQDYHRGIGPHPAVVMGLPNKDGRFPVAMMSSAGLVYDPPSTKFNEIYNKPGMKEETYIRLDPPMLVKRATPWKKRNGGGELQEPLSPAEMEKLREKMGA